MASPSASSAASDLLGAALSDADRRDREALNLKMEIAHLRERLLLRVGGDASAAALEAEAFALRSSLADAQGDAARAQQALQALDAKYAKALRNLVKMDQAWKSSAAKLAQAKQDAAAHEATLRARDEQLAALQAQHESDAAKRQTLVAYQEERIAALEATVRVKESELARHVDLVHTATLRAKELESELEATRARHENGGNNTQPTRVVPRDEFEALQTRHQEALEAAAAVRGETNALRDERASLQTQLSDTKASLTAAMAKFLQLKEEHATLEVRVAAAHEASEQSARDAAFYKREVDRVQGELTKRDEEALQLERAKQVLERQLAQQQWLAQDAVQVRDHEAKRLELQQELSWKDREFALENEVRALQKQCAGLEADADRVRAFHDELCDVLVGGGIGRDGDSLDLKSLVALAVELHSEAAFTAEQQQKQVNRLEKELARMKTLAEENASLKAEYEKTRLAMERIVGRKSKATANTQRFATGAASSAGSATPPTGSSSSVGAGRGALSGVTQRRSFGENDTSNKAASSWMNNSSSSASTSSAAAAAAAVGTKRRLDMPPTSDAAPSSGTIFSPRSKRVVHVASRYLQSSKR